jgi:hypothetical protein
MAHCWTRYTALTEDGREFVFAEGTDDAFARRWCEEHAEFVRLWRTMDWAGLGGCDPGMQISSHCVWKRPGTEDQEHWPVRY